MSIRTLTAVALTAGLANAGVSTFTETFEGGANGWLQGSFSAPTYNAAGALDGSAYITSTADLNSAGPFGLTVFRGQDDFDASGDAFVGDYLAGGINRISFDFRHNAGQDLGIALRVATSNNFPAFAVELASPVASGEWVTLSFDLSFFNPLLTIEGAPTPDAFNAIMQSVGNIQVSADRPDGLSTPLEVDFDLDNVSITPAPGSVALLGLGGLAAVRRRR
ncbi:MAG: PEP-CTERM sorting domain-containing protein [Phycisphaerales bacterium]|nr:PEP-CTERM sorting domain-containing protein [Phycisphaerales bacterium]